MSEDKVMQAMEHMTQQLEEEKKARKKVERELSDIKKLLSPDDVDESDDTPIEPSVSPEVAEALGFIREQKQEAERKKKAKESRYRLSKSDEVEEEANDLWKSMLKSAEEEEE